MVPPKLLQQMLVAHVAIAIVHSYLHMVLHIDPRLIDWLVAVPTSILLPLIILASINKYQKSAQNLTIVISVFGILHGILSHLVLESEDNIIHNHLGTGEIAFIITVFLLLITQFGNLLISAHLKHTNCSVIITN